EPDKWQLWEDGKYRDLDPEAVQTQDSFAPPGVDKPPSKALLNMLAVKRQVKAYPDDKADADLGLDEKANPIEVTIWEGGIKDKKDTKAEPKLEKETVKLFFSGKPEKDMVYVKRQRDKETRKLAVSEGLLAKISEGKLAYLDKTLPLFKRDEEVTK